MTSRIAERLRPFHHNLYLPCGELGEKSVYQQQASRDWEIMRSFTEWKNSHVKLQGDVSIANKPSCRLLFAEVVLGKGFV